MSFNRILLYISCYYLVFFIFALTTEPPTWLQVTFDNARLEQSSFQKYYGCTLVLLVTKPLEDNSLKCLSTNELIRIVSMPLFLLVYDKRSQLGNDHAIHDWFATTLCIIFLAWSSVRVLSRGLSPCIYMFIFSQ